MLFMALALVSALSVAAEAARAQRPRRTKAPEIDPVGIPAVAALLIGSVAIVKSRRRAA